MMIRHHIPGIEKHHATCPICHVQFGWMNANTKGHEYSREIARWRRVWEERDADKTRP